MKALKTLFAVSAVALAVQANAATYTVTGVQTEFDAKINTGEALGLPARATSIVTPAQPAISGSFEIDAAAASIGGGINVASYTTDTAVELWGDLYDVDGNPVLDGDGNPVQGWSPLGNVLFDWTNNGYNLSSGSSSWDAATRTLSFVGTGTNSGTAANPVCSGNELFCSFAPADTQVTESINISLVFSEDLNSFTGTATITDFGENQLTDTNGDEIGDMPLFEVITKYSLQGSAPVSEVPVPAAAWLFGSALVGLVGAKRRRA